MARFFDNGDAATIAVSSDVRLALQRGPLLLPRHGPFQEGDVRAPSTVSYN